jgi:hypothetical protein
VRLDKVSERAHFHPLYKQQKMNDIVLRIDRENDDFSGEISLIKQLVTLQGKCAV